MDVESQRIEGSWPRMSRYVVHDGALTPAPEATELRSAEPHPRAWIDLVNLGLALALGELPRARRGRPRHGAVHARTALDGAEREARCLAFVNEHGVLGLLDHCLVGCSIDAGMTHTDFFPFSNPPSPEWLWDFPTKDVVLYRPLVSSGIEWKPLAFLDRFRSPWHNGRGASGRVHPTFRAPRTYREPLPDFELAAVTFALAFAKTFPLPAPGAPGLGLSRYDDDEAEVRNDRAHALMRAAYIRPVYTRVALVAWSRLARLALDASASIEAAAPLSCPACGRFSVGRSRVATYCSARCRARVSQASKRARDSQRATAAREAEERAAARREALNRKRRDARAAKRDAPRKP